MRYSISATDFCEKQSYSYTSNSNVRLRWAISQLYAISLSLCLFFLNHRFLKVGKAIESALSRSRMNTDSNFNVIVVLPLTVLKAVQSSAVRSKTWAATCKASKFL